MQNGRLCFCIFIVILFTFFTQAVVSAAEVVGIPRVVDGDTLVIGATKVRLQGVDAPETDQVCLNGNGGRWTCGIEARDRLAAHVAGREIVCASQGVDGYGRMLGVCSLRGEDLNAWVVREGWALAYVTYSSAYAPAEKDAHLHKRGLWQGAFIAPWDWRHRNAKTAILGAVDVPLNAQSLLLPVSGANGSPSSDCIIKGNINVHGERIYHMPNQKFYPRIKMDVGGGRRWFCTPEEAEAAGWRRALL